MKHLEFQSYKPKRMTSKDLFCSVKRYKIGLEKVKHDDN